MMRIPALTLAAVAVAAALLAGCGGDDAKKTNDPTALAGEPTRAVYTGDGAIDQVIEAALAADDIALAGLVGYQTIACTKDSPEAPGDPPRCRETEADGALVEVLPATTACNPTWVRPEQVPDIFRLDFPKDSTSLGAVARVRPDPAAFGGGFGATEMAVFATGQHQDTQPMGVALHLKNGRVVWIEADCTSSLALLAPERIDSYILDPSGTRTSLTPAAADTPAPAATEEPPVE